jgi:hypothetical protein
LAASSAWHRCLASTGNCARSRCSCFPKQRGRSLTLRYKDGEKTIVVPDNVPVVTFKPGDKALLVPEAKVMVTTQLRDGKPTALRALAGRDGFTPPM